VGKTTGYSVREENPPNFQAPPGYKTQKLPCQHLKISCFCISFTARRFTSFVAKAHASDLWSALASGGSLRLSG
jgi:hypothetical protein